MITRSTALESGATYGPTDADSTTSHECEEFAPAEDAPVAWVLVPGGVVSAAGVWLSWPRPEGISFRGDTTRSGRGLRRSKREIALREEVHINVPNENWEHIVRRELAALWRAG